MPGWRWIYSGSDAEFHAAVEYIVNAPSNPALSLRWMHTAPRHRPGAVCSALSVAQKSSGVVRPLPLQFRGGSTIRAARARSGLARRVTTDRYKQYSKVANNARGFVNGSKPRSAVQRPHRQANLAAEFPGGRVEERVFRVKLKTRPRIHPQPLAGSHSANKAVQAWAISGTLRENHTPRINRPESSWSACPPAAHIAWRRGHAGVVAALRRVGQLRVVVADAVFGVGQQCLGVQPGHKLVAPKLGGKRLSRGQCGAGRPR